MSTFINVNVDLQGILNRLKDQQKAQRQAQLEKEKNQTFEEQVAEATQQFEQQQLRGFRSTPATRQQGRALRRDELAAWRGGCRPGADLLPGGAYVNAYGNIAKPGGYNWLRVYNNTAVRIYDRFNLTCQDRNEYWYNTLFLIDYETIVADNAPKGYPLYPNGYPGAWDPINNPPIGEWVWIGGIQHLNVSRELTNTWPGDTETRCGPYVSVKDTITYEPFATRGEDPAVLDTMVLEYILMPARNTIPKFGEVGYDDYKFVGCTWGPPSFEFLPYEDAPSEPAKCYFINGVAQYS